MISILEGYIKGGQERRAETAARSTEAFKGLEMGALRSDIRTRKKAARQARNIEAGVQGYLGGDPEAAGVLQGLGPEGREALGSLKESEQATRDQALADLKAWGPAAIQMKQGPERESSDLWLAKTMQDAGVIGAGVARAYLNSDPETKDAIIGALAGGDESGIPGDWVEYNKGDGTSIMMNERDPEDQEMIRANRDTWTPAPKREEIRTGELPKGEETELRDYESTTSTFIARGQSILDLLAENPEANTVVSVLEKTGMNLMTEARQIASDAGFESLEEEIRGYDAAGTSSFLEKQGITSARMQGQIVALAYMQAKIFDKGGRVTDKDFKFALKALGANNSNPKAFAATLKDQMRLAEQGFRSDYRRRKKVAYEGSFGTEAGGIPAPEGVAEGQQIIQNGILYVNRGGFMVPVQ